MKKITKYILIGGICLGLASCQKNFIDLSPKDQFTDAVYFKQASDFKDYATSFYGQLPGWSFNSMDNGTDLSANALGTGNEVADGTIAAGSTSWSYSGIRSCNILLSKAKTYKGKDDISQYVGEAYFFRAFDYFGLLKEFGGVPIDTTVLDVNSPELYAPRNSRYEVVKQILSDLGLAIPKLPIEQNIPAADKGRISKWAAEAVKAEVELYEATWERYVGKATDGDGTTVGAGSAGYDPSDIDKYLADVATMCKDIMDNGGYSLWDHNDDPSMDSLSSWYLFNLEDAGSNPGGYDKTTNHEFILYKVYDYTYKQSGLNLSWTSAFQTPSFKFVNMAVCKDGLPPDKSPMFQGYHHEGDEFKNRDLRLISYLFGANYGSYPNIVPITSTLNFSVHGSSGYGNSKYAVYGYGDRRTDNTESANWPIIRLAEVYLMYAESVYELNGKITDAQLDASINNLRDRAGVAHLTNELADTYGLDMKQEIRRARAVELYREGKRLDDLKRWGILVQALKPSRLGRVVGSKDYTTDFKDANGNPTQYYDANTYIYGEESEQTADGMLNCVVVDSKANHGVSEKNYLYPIPVSQIELNHKLLQNPGY
jgi:hypothetical protein